jgi:hypothetical protein
MFRIAILTAVLAAGAGGVLSARPIRSYPPPPAPIPLGIEGRWFMSGDPIKPCFIEAVPGRGGPVLILTNEKGEQSRGRLLLGGRRVIADDWEPDSGGLVGDIRGTRIVWHNGTDWIR